MTRLNSPDDATLARFAAVVGDKYLLRDKQDTLPYTQEPRDLFAGRPAAVLRPGTPEQVAELLAIANAARCAIVPQSGNTGLVGGQVADDSGSEVVLSLGRLKNIRALDPANNTLAADAGVVLADLQAAADGAGKLFPLSLGSEGTCQIGGNLSSNAGGTNVLAYGNARDLVLGLEVALADGRLWSGMRGLRKDNTGYDLKNLFIGAEGTLGVITGCVLKLFEKPADRATAWIGVPDPDAALKLLARARSLAGGEVTSFEFLSRQALDLVFAHIPGTRDPLSRSHDWYVLMQIEGTGPAGHQRQYLEDILASALGDGLATDAAIAQSRAQEMDFWRLREGVPEAQGHAGGSIKHDISVPQSTMPAFLKDADVAALAVIPGCRPVPFGHLGDGNVHYNISQPADMDAAAFLARWEDMSEAVFAIVERYNGSISAEHGIGRLKAGHMAHIKSKTELELMASIKDLLDPNGILNPGRVLPATG